MLEERSWPPGPYLGMHVTCECLHTRDLHACDLRMVRARDLPVGLLGPCT